MMPEHNNVSIASVLIRAAAVFATVMVTALEVSAISVHPSLYTTPAGVELARSRVQNEQWAKDIVAKLRQRTDSFANEKLPVFEKDWWQEASKKHWSQIYPEINYHTGSAVAGPMSQCLNAAIVYTLTQEKQYAELARKVLLHYTGYEFFAKHPDVGLNIAVWCSRGLMAYDLVYDTIPEADREKIDDFFTRAMNTVMHDDQWWIENNPGGMFNNHFAWHKFLIGSYGLLYDRADLVEYALESDQGIRELIEYGSMDDGLWFESSLNYHFTAVHGLVEFARQLANSNHAVNLWHHEFANGRSLKQLFTGPINTLFPDETIPMIGDTYGRQLKLGNVKVYFLAYDAYRTPEIAWVIRAPEDIPADALFLRHLPEKPAAPAMYSRVWPEHGYIALRTQEGQDYWRGDGYSVFFSFDINSVHSHNDKFDLMVFGRGAHLATDPEALASATHAFSAQVQAELNRSTICHNTVMVDRCEQRPIGTKLELVEFITAPETKMATVADREGRVYPGVKMMRTVAATPDYVLDVFQVTSDEEHTYEYLFHSLDDKGSFDAGEGFESIEIGDAPPWKWIRNARSRKMEGDWQATARQGDLVMRFMMLGEPGTQVITCEFPKKDDFSPVPYPMLITRRQAKSTVFISLIQAERGAFPETSVQMSTDRHGYMRIIVNCGGNTREFSVEKL